MNKVLFLRGLKQFYSAEKYPDAIYFATDTREILINGTSFGFNMEDPDLDLISIVEFISPDTIKFQATNGHETLVKFPVVTKEASGLMSSSDKLTLDNIPNLYATKQELNQAIVGVYRFKGVVNNLDELPTEGQQSGDTYKIREEFELDGLSYSKGTHVVWNGEAWKAMEGEDPGYTKEEANNLFVAWVEYLGNKAILLPKKSTIFGTMIGEEGADEGVSLLQLGIYEDGAVLQTEVGSVKVHLNLNSGDRPTVELKDKSKEEIAYLSDINSLGISWNDVI